MNEVHPRLAIGAQIGPGDILALAGEGFTDIVCNRPDDEHPDGPVSSRMSAAAAQAGMRFHYVPVVPGGPVDAAAECLSDLLRKPQARVFAYCRSGARSTAAWQIAQGSAPAQ